MGKHYFLSEFVGAGTELDMFRPLAEKLGQWNMLDLRPDETKQEGWCLVCVTAIDQTVTEAEAGLVYLGDDANVNLNADVISKIKASLGINFKSQKLGEIVAEILLTGLISGRGIKQGIDGKYVVNLSGSLWEATEAETFEFIGKLREDELLGTPPNRSPISTTDLKKALANDLATIVQTVERGEPNWLDTEIARNSAGQNSHPLAVIYIECSELLNGSDAAHINSSSAVIWLMMLARDLRITSSKIDFDYVASRLRSKHDCEPTKYELHIMASYIEAGIPVEITDTNSTGEFRAYGGGQWVHVECKHKNISAMSPRKVRDVFKKGNDLLRELMTSKDARSFIQITCRTDPLLEELPNLIDHISSSLDCEQSKTGLLIRHGKFEVKISPGIHIADDMGVRLPTGFDFGFAEATVDEDLNDKVVLRSGWGVQWRVQRPGGWIRSVTDSFRKAASGVPKNSANLVYIHIPTTSLGAMVTRIDFVEPEIVDLLNTPERYGRVNAVILTGEAIVRNWGAPNIATVRYIHKVINNQGARITLPSEFRIFGLDFTRNRSS